MFPLTASGVVSATREVPGSKDRLMARVQEELRLHEPSEIVISQDSLRFQGGMFRWTRRKPLHNLLVAITRGTVEASEHGATVELSYTLWFSELVAAAVPLSTAAFILAEETFVFRFAGFLFVWIFVVGGNYVLAVGRFRAMLRRACRVSAVSESMRAG